MNQDYVFREAGEALFLAQGLEMNIRIIVELVNRKSKSKIDVALIVDATEKRTLGQLIHEMKKLGDLDSGAAASLRDALESRNYIAHHFFVRNARALNGGPETKAALEVLKAHTVRIAAATAMASGFVHAFCQSFNVDRSTILVEQDIDGPPSTAPWPRPSLEDPVNFENQPE